MLIFMCDLLNKIKLYLDSKYTFSIDLAAFGVPFRVKLIEKIVITIQI